MKDLKLDFVNKKVINELIDKKDRVIQQIRLAVNVWVGDWFLDEDFGVYDLADVENVPFIVTIDGAGTGNDYQGVALDMEFEVQAVQAANVDPNAVPFATVVPET